MLSYPKISEAGIAIFLKDNVLWLEVFVDDFHFVDVFEGEQDAGGYKL